MSHTENILSSESILLSILVIANILTYEGYSFQMAFYVMIVLFYIILDYLSHSVHRKNSFFGISVEEYCRKHKHTLILLTILLLVIWPALSSIHERSKPDSEYYPHDGVIQTEEAVKFLLQGKNPYTEDYFETPLNNWNLFNSEGYGVNPALYHYVYLPFLPLFAIPFHLFFNAFLGWFDLRFVFIPLFFVAIFILGKLTKDDSKRLQLWILFSLNPWFASFFDDGRNDIFLLTWIILSVYYLKKNNILLSSVFLAFGCMSKQIAWFILPFYFAYLLKGKFSISSLAMVLRKTYPLFVISFFILTPFLVWDYHSFIDDTISYTAGTSKISYPAGGYGLAAMMVDSGMIKFSDYFPFWIPQLLVGLPLLYLLMKNQQSNNTLKSMLTNYTLLTFALLYFSRIFNDNYLGYIISLMALAYYID